MVAGVAVAAASVEVGVFFAEVGSERRPQWTAGPCRTDRPPEASEGT